MSNAARRGHLLSVSHIWMKRNQILIATRVNSSSLSFEVMKSADSAGSSDASVFLTENDVLTRSSEDADELHSQMVEVEPTEVTLVDVRNADDCECPSVIEGPDDADAVGVPDKALHVESDDSFSLDHSDLSSNLHGFFGSLIDDDGTEDVRNSENDETSDWYPFPGPTFFWLVSKASVVCPAALGLQIYRLFLVYTTLALVDYQYRKL
ncbi:hypothetical protein HK096_009197 [Nowakowskiella sp. JEL0078]|nr:hypothetical protein HK096_009197 [Nowakowskiella sp. JEL0078]